MGRERYVIEATFREGRSHRGVAAAAGTLRRELDAAGRPQQLQRLSDAVSLRCACRHVRIAALLDGGQTQRHGQDRRSPRRALVTTGRSPRG